MQSTLCHRADFKLEANLPEEEKAHKTVKPASIKTCTSPAVK